VVRAVGTEGGLSRAPPTDTVLICKLLATADLMKSEILINHFHLLIGLYPAELALCVKWQFVYLKGILINVKFVKLLSDK